MAVARVEHHLECLAGELQTVDELTGSSSSPFHPHLMPKARKAELAALSNQFLEEGMKCRRRDAELQRGRREILV